MVRIKGNGHETVTGDNGKLLLGGKKCKKEGKIAENHVFPISRVGTSYLGPTFIPLPTLKHYAQADYELRNLFVYDSENPRACYTFSI